MIVTRDEAGRLTVHKDECPLVRQLPAAPGRSLTHRQIIDGLKIGRMQNCSTCGGWQG